MRIGILSDVHEANAELRRVVGRGRVLGVERFVVLGDVFESGKALGETVAILRDADASGVWGNHDLGLAVDPTPAVRARYPRAVVEYFAALAGRLHVGDCLIGHFQAWMDPADPEQPWYWNGVPASADELARNFAATDRRLLFMGHYHRWLVARPGGVLDWQGPGTFRFEGGRHLVVVPAVCDGWCVVYDTIADELLGERV